MNPDPTSKWLKLMKHHHKETFHHSFRVASLTRAIAQEMGFSLKEQHLFRIGHFFMILENYTSIQNFSEKRKTKSARAGIDQKTPYFQLPGSPKDQTSIEKNHPADGPLFEQTLQLFYDVIILRFMEKKGLDSETMYGNHANLE